MQLKRGTTSPLPSPPGADQPQRAATAGVLRGFGTLSFAMYCGSQNRDPSGNSPRFNHAPLKTGRFCDKTTAMRAVIQRVSEAKVEIEGQTAGAIGRGLFVLAAMDAHDTAEDLSWTAGKIFRMRLFNDTNGVMNLDLSQVGGEILVVSQFTLFASTKKGNRPSFSRSAPPDAALPLYLQFLREMALLLRREPAQGRFGADMKVSLMNDGPVTILMDSRDRE